MFLSRTLEQQNGVRVEGEVASLRHQLRQLQEKLQQQLGHEKSLRDENDHLRKRWVCDHGLVGVEHELVSGR